MNVDRIIPKYGALQTKKRKKNATLLRKPKYIYEEEQWVALCIHKSTIPFLEWYSTATDIAQHQPIQIMDLLECQYVNITIGENRCFNIGFSDTRRPVIELCARTEDEAKEWVREITHALRDLKCLDSSSNEYQTMPINNREEDDKYAEQLSPGFIRRDPPPQQPSPVLNREFNLSHEIPLIPSIQAPPLPPRPENMHHGVPPQPQLPPPSNPVRIPLPVDKNYDHLPPHSPHSNSPPTSPKNHIIAKSPPGRSKKSSICSIADEDLPPRLPRRKEPSKLSTELPLSPTSEAKKEPPPVVVIRYDFPLPVNETPTSSPRTSLNGTSPNNYHQHHPKHIIPETISTSSAAVSNDLIKYDLLPFAPPPPPPSGHSDLAGVVQRNPASLGSSKENSSCNNNIYHFFQPLPSAAAPSPHPSGTEQQPIYTKFNFPTDSSIASTSDESGRSSSRLSSDMTQLRMSSTSSSTEDSNDSAKSSQNCYYSSPSQNSATNNCIAPPPRPPKSAALSASSLNYAGSFREKSAVTKEISLLLSICEEILFVEIAGGVWIAGWNIALNSSLCNLIHFGDQIVEVKGTPIKSILQFPAVFHENTLPGIPIPIKIRRLPHGTTYLFNKPSNIYTPKTLGIILHKKKNRIEEIIPQSTAFKSGLLSRQQPFLWGREYVSSVITEVNGIPLNPFATNDQFYKRLEQLENGSEIQIVLHPYDFCKLIKQQMKGKKDGKKFIQP